MKPLFICIAVYVTICSQTIAVSSTLHWPIDTCKSERTRMTCVGSIPYTIPHNLRILEVELQELRSDQLNRSKCVFCHQSWQNVEKLTIVSNTLADPINRLYDNQFKGLGNLESILISLPHLYHELPTSTFDGLENVIILDMSNCQEMSITNLINSIANPGILPKLSKLVLQRLNFMDDGRNNISYEMVHKLANGRNITELDLSNTRLIIPRSDHPNILFHPMRKSLRLLNISNTMLLHAVDKVNEDLNDNTDTILETVDISACHLYKAHELTDDTTVVNKHIGHTSKYHHSLRFFAHVKTLYARDLSRIVPGKYIYVYNSVINVTMNVSLTNLDVSNNGLKWMDGIIVSEYMSLKSLDMSRNDMEYLKPVFLQQSCMTSILTLNLSHNMLSEMEKENATEFESLFSSLKFLTYLDISHNNIYTIPSGTFVHNTNMQVLALSNNKLTHVTFQLDTLKELKYFDISANRIKQLDTTTMQILNNIYTNQTRGTRVQINVNLRRNPLQCSLCSSLDFISAVYRSPFIDEEGEYTCESENQVIKNITEDTITYIQHMCDRTKIVRRIIIISTLIPVASLILIVLTVKYTLILITKRRVEAHVKDKRQQIENNQYGFKYPIFLSYSSLDDDVVLNHLYRELHHQLRVTCRTDRELVCIGDKHFRAGRWIFDEVSRCLEMSALLVVVMSRNYCDSDWCQAEVQQAYQLHKPMLLISIEHVDERDMPPLLREHFQKHVRVQFVQHNCGNYEIIPNWENVCTSILALQP